MRDFLWVVVVDLTFWWYSKLNAGIAVQTLIDTFDIQGIAHYGIVGSTNDSLNIGDVSVLNYVAFTGSWKWKLQV